jgi:putative DNA primase/helicase
MRLNLDVIPSDLKGWKQWVVWRSMERGGKKTKPPYCPATGLLASVNAPSTWGSFEEAHLAWKQGHYDGLAFILADWDPFCGIDLDHCTLASGQIAPWAQRIADHFASYTEWSPSRRGLHIWIRGVLPGPRRRKHSVEMYQAFRSLTLTGWHLEGTPTLIEERQEELERFYHHLFREEDKPQMVQASRQFSITPDDEALKDRAMRARNGSHFARLWAGDVSDHHGNHSEADLALCGYLVFWTGGDAERVDRLFRQSGLMRDKWDRPHFASGETYGQRTIALALAGNRGVSPVGGSRSKVRTS